LYIKQAYTSVAFSRLCVALLLLLHLGYVTILSRCMQVSQQLKSIQCCRTSFYHTAPRTCRL